MEAIWWIVSLSALAVGIFSTVISGFLLYVLYMTGRSIADSLRGED